MAHKGKLIELAGIPTSEPASLTPLCALLNIEAMAGRAVERTDAAPQALLGEFVEDRMAPIVCQAGLCMICLRRESAESLAPHVLDRLRIFRRSRLELRHAEDPLALRGIRLRIVPVADIGEIQVHLDRICEEVVDGRAETAPCRIAAEHPGDHRVLTASEIWLVSRLYHRVDGIYILERTRIARTHAEDEGVLLLDGRRVDRRILAGPLVLEERFGLRRKMLAQRLIRP